MEYRDRLLGGLSFFRVISPMTPTERAHIRYRYLTDPTFNAEHHQMADMVAQNAEHWHIALEMSLYGRAFVWVSPLGRCTLLNEDDLEFKTSGNQVLAYFKMPERAGLEAIPTAGLVELVMVGDTQQRKASNGTVELRRLAEFQQQRRGF